MEEKLKLEMHRSNMILETDQNENLYKSNIMVNIKGLGFYNVLSLEHAQSHDRHHWFFSLKKLLLPIMPPSPAAFKSTPEVLVSGQKIWASSYAYHMQSFKV